MTAPTDRPGPSRRAALERARRSRRPSRLGDLAGVADGPDRERLPDAGFPGLLARTWQVAVGAPDPRQALQTLLTLDEHVPGDIQLRALRSAEECAIRVLFGLSWRSDSCDPGLVQVAGDRAFPGEIGLTTSGRVAVRVPSQRLLGQDETLVDGVLRIPWSHQALDAYRRELGRTETRHAERMVDCRAWLDRAGTEGREGLLRTLQEAALRTAPFVLYHEDRHYTNFRDHNTLIGKTLWPGHPDCVLSSLIDLPLELWSDADAMLVVALTLLVRSSGFGRIEEVNGTQVTVDHVADLLERTRIRYGREPGGEPVAAAVSTSVDDLDHLARALSARRKELAGRVQLYRRIHGPLMHKVEVIAAPRSHQAHRRERDVAVRLSRRLPFGGTDMEELSAALSARPGFLARPHGGFATGLESVVFEVVDAALLAFDADFAMSRGMRSLPDLIEALGAEDWRRICDWELPEYFCCVLPSPQAHEYFGGSPQWTADAAWAMAARMQYNSWHFVPGNLPPDDVVRARDHFVPPSMPDIALHSDQHHHGHVATGVRFSVRSPQPVVVAGRTFAGFVDLRLLRCAGTPFGEQDLLAAHRISAFVAHATTLAAGLAEQGERVEVTAFDSEWHAKTIIGGASAGIESPERPGRPDRRSSR